MSEVLAEWSDFTAGHWGNIGPNNPPKNSWGGVNMTLTRQGGLTPVCASRWLQLNASPVGKIWGVFWAWGADGKVYYIQQAGASGVSSNLYRFAPDPTALPNTLSTTSTFAYVPTVEPDWVELGTTIYVTIYGNKTYTIATAGNTMLKLTGNYGDAPAGRCICLYNQQLLIGGISDAVFGTHTNRIHFSGDLTGFGGGNPVPSDRTAWEALNYVDIGTDGDVVTGLYQVRDFIVAVLDDQSIYTITGELGTSTSIRRIYGFHKGSGGINSFVASQGAVDPGQTKVWLYDHTYRAPIRFNGATVTRVKPLGVPQSDREGDALIEGQLAMIGGPDEFMVHGVALSRSAGEGVIGRRLELVRINGIWVVVQNDVVAARA